jgi:hypothetical protein
MVGPVASRFELPFEGGLPKVFKSEEGEVDKALTLLQNDETEQRQIASIRTYGIARPDILESILIRLDATYKWNANDGYYIARIERLNESDSTAKPAKSGFLNSRRLDVGRLKMAAKGIIHKNTASRLKSRLAARVAK